MDKFRVFVYMLMRDASLKQRILCIIRISMFGAFSAGKKCALYTGKYGSNFLENFFISSWVTSAKLQNSALQTVTSEGEDPMRIFLSTSP